MTVQPTRDQLLDMTERLRSLGDRPELCDEVVSGLWAALDHAVADSEKRGELVARALAVSETWRKRAVRSEAQSETRRLQAEYWQDRARGLAQEVKDERGAALDQMEQVRIRDARIKAVRDVLDNPIHLADWDDPLVPATHIRRALDGEG